MIARAREASSCSNLMALAWKTLCRRRCFAFTTARSRPHAGEGETTLSPGPHGGLPRGWNGGYQVARATISGHRPDVDEPRAQALPPSQPLEFDRRFRVPADLSVATRAIFCPGLLRSLQGDAAEGHTGSMCRCRRDHATRTLSSQRSATCHHVLHRTLAHVRRAQETLRRPALRHRCCGACWPLPWRKCERRQQATPTN